MNSRCSRGPTPLLGGGRPLGSTRRHRHTAANFLALANLSGRQRFGRRRRNLSADSLHGLPSMAKSLPRITWLCADGPMILYASFAESTLNRFDTCFWSAASRRRCASGFFDGTVPLGLHQLLLYMTLMGGGMACWTESQRRKDGKLAETSSTPCGGVGKSATGGFLGTQRCSRSWLPTLFWKRLNNGGLHTRKTQEATSLNFLFL